AHVLKRGIVFLNINAMRKANKTLRRRLNKLRKSKRFIPAVIVISSVMALGLVTTFLTRAAGPFVSIEAEKGRVTSPATKGSDAAASGGQYIQFNTPTPPPTGNCDLPKYPTTVCTCVPDRDCVRSHTGARHHEWGPA